jgi:K+-sensing histidine kinase KdpD
LPELFEGQQWLTQLQQNHVSQYSRITKTRENFFAFHWRASSYARTSKMLLISNAIKFTPMNGHVELRLESSGRQTEIVVQDNGDGILPEFLPHVFERFRQGDGSTTRRTGGLGLGLAVVRYLVEAHGGRVRASSLGLNQGSTFIVSLPNRGSGYL